MQFNLKCATNYCTYMVQPSRSYACGSVRVAERLALPTSDHGVAGSNPAGGEILPEPKRRFIAQSLSCSPFHRLEMTEILLKGRKTLTHPSIRVRLLIYTVGKTFSIFKPRHNKTNNMNVRPAKTQISLGIHPV